MQLYHEKNAGGIRLQKQEPKGLSCLSLQSLTSLGCLVFLPGHLSEPQQNLKIAVEKPQGEVFADPPTHAHIYGCHLIL